MQPTSSPSPPLFPGFTESRLALADQVEMAYIDNGCAGSYPPLVLLHGVFDNKATWFRLARRLPGRRIIAPDLIGHGRSSKPSFAAHPAHERYSPDMQAGYLAAFIAALGLDDAILLGNSLGGGLALRSYLNFPALAAKVRGLVLIAAAGYPHKLPCTSAPSGAIRASCWATRQSTPWPAHPACCAWLFGAPSGAASTTVAKSPRTRNGRSHRTGDAQRRVCLPLLSEEPHPSRRSNVPPVLWHHRLPDLGLVGPTGPHPTRALGPALRRPALYRPTHLPQLRPRTPPRIPRRDGRLHRAMVAKACGSLAIPVNISATIIHHRRLSYRKPFD